MGSAFSNGKKDNDCDCGKKDCKKCEKQDETCGNDAPIDPPPPVVIDPPVLDIPNDEPPVQPAIIDQPPQPTPPPKCRTIKKEEIEEIIKSVFQPYLDKLKKCQKDDCKETKKKKRKRKRKKPAKKPRPSPFPGLSSSSSSSSSSECSFLSSSDSSSPCPSPPPLSTFKKQQCEEKESQTEETPKESTSSTTPTKNGNSPEKADSSPPTHDNHKMKASQENDPTPKQITSISKAPRRSERVSKPKRFSSSPDITSRPSPRISSRNKDKKKKK